MDNQYLPEPVEPAEVQIETEDEPQPLTPSQKRMVIYAIVVGLLFLIVFISTTAYLVTHPVSAAIIRDIMIIYMGFFMLLNGVVLVILMVQLARLINLLNNEIKPILDSTNETVSNLRGTTTFLANNLTEPVIRLNEYLAGLTTLLESIGIIRKKSRRK